jgi:hypothetical protein
LDRAKNSWYKFDNTDIPVVLRPNEKNEKLTYLSQLSSVISGLKPIDQARIYVPSERKDELKNKVEKCIIKKIKGELG